MLPSAGDIQTLIQEHLDGIAQAEGMVPARAAARPDTNLLELGLLDSLGFIALLVAMEASLGLSLDLAGGNQARFTTLGGLVELAGK